jgi:hypothetical protein
MATVDGIALLNKYSFQCLGSASDSFKNGNQEQGFENFKNVFPLHQNKIYEQIWLDRGRPQNNSEYGRQAFNDTDGLYSTMEEKAAAIDRYLESVGVTRTSASDQSVKMIQGSNGSDYEWTHVGGKWHHHPKGHPPPTDMDKIWCPTTKDECLQVGIVLGAAGAVAAGVYAVFQAVRGAIR